LLAELGITSVRHRDETVRLSYPERTASGVYRVYESMNLRVAKHYDYVEKAKIFIRKAMERGAAYALWFHPSDPKELFDTQFRGILRHIRDEARAGRVWIATMQELASYCEARAQLELRVERDAGALYLSFDSELDTKYGTPEVTLRIPCDTRPKQ